MVFLSTLGLNRVALPSLSGCVVRDTSSRREAKGLRFRGDTPWNPQAKGSKRFIQKSFGKRIAVDAVLSW